jgi:hypothetical protein
MMPKEKAIELVKFYSKYNNVLKQRNYKGTKENGNYSCGRGN